VISDWRSASLALPRGSPLAPKKTLYCYSPSVVPTPSDWPPDAIATGYWLRDDQSDAEPLNPDLESFLAAGTPTIYIGFGSSVGPDSVHLAAVVSNAVQQAGLRAVIASGWGALRGVQGTSNTMVIESAPHRSLFPHVAAVVHHGGAGDDSCRSTRGAPHDHLPLPGRPALLGGCGSPGRGRAQPMPAKRLTPERLASAIQKARDDGDMRTRSSELSMGIAGEDGTGRASEQIESILT
jgi:sterol 3beta-glucosyltransferase